MPMFDHTFVCEDVAKRLDGINHVLHVAHSQQIVEMKLGVSQQPFLEVNVTRTCIFVVGKSPIEWKMPFMRLLVVS
jgi:hypothetical protein